MLTFIFHVFFLSAYFNTLGQLTDCPCHDSEECYQLCSHAEMSGDSLLDVNDSMSLICRGEKKMAIGWSYKNKFSKFQLAMNEVSLNLSTSAITQIVTKNYSEIVDIKGGYVFEVTPFRDGVLDEKLSLVSDVFRTLPDNTKPTRIVEAKISKMYASEDHVLAILFWTPAAELVCDYEIVLWDFLNMKSTQLQPNLEELLTYHYTIHDLEYATHYNVAISALTDAHESEKYWLDFRTPSCAQMHNYNYAICIPDKPENFSVTLEHCNVIISWDLPPILPDYYFMRVFPKSDPLYNEYKINQMKNRISLDAKTFVENIRVQLIPMAYSRRGPPAMLTRPNPCFKRDKSMQGTGRDEQMRVSGFFLLALIIFLIFYTLLLICSKENAFKKRENTRIQDETFELDETPRGGGENKCEIEDKKKPDKYEIKRELLIISEILGKGEFGIVSKGLLKTATSTLEVAVKELKENATVDDRRRFEEEVELMITVGSHPNLVSLFGYCRLEKLLIVEYCCVGDLKEFLRSTRILKMKDHQPSIYKNPKAGMMVATNALYFQSDLQRKQLSLNTADLLTFAQQIALGMEYLALNRVIHRDLAARNILLTSDLTAKISDFGLSRDVYEEDVYKKSSTTKLPIKWMAVESLAYDIFTTESDVWSFGVLLWEIMTLGGVPYPTIPSKDILGLLKKGIRLDKPPSCSEHLYDWNDGRHKCIIFSVRYQLMMGCWDVQPSSRPSFKDITAYLTDFMSIETKEYFFSLDAEHSVIVDSFHDYDTEMKEQTECLTSVNDPDEEPTEEVVSSVNSELASSLTSSGADGWEAELTPVPSATPVYANQTPVVLQMYQATGAEGRPTSSLGVEEWNT